MDIFSIRGKGIINASEIKESIKYFKEKENNIGIRQHDAKMVRDYFFLNPIMKNRYKVF